MLKIITLIPAKAGLSQEEFREYYETKHAPLMNRLLPLKNYIRNYPDLRGARLPPGQDKLPFSAIAEVWFDDRAAYQDFLERQKDPALLAQIRNDEANFVDSANVLRFLVDEVKSLSGK